MGMGTVFLVLGVLAGLLGMLNRSFASLPSEKDSLACLSNASTKESETPAQNLAVVAAAMGAIAALEGDRQFKIISISPVNQPKATSAWVRAGRDELMETSQPFLG